jgi:hypothetical protein
MQNLAEVISDYVRETRRLEGLPSSTETTFYPDVKLLLCPVCINDSAFQTAIVIHATVVRFRARVTATRSARRACSKSRALALSRSRRPPRDPSKIMTS